MYLIPVIIHLIVCVLVYLLMRFDKLRTRELMLPVVFCVPVCGFLLLIVEEHELRKKNPRKRELTVGSFKISDKRFKRIEVDDDSNRDITVPLEEAIAVDDAPVRRKLMMDILHRNPEEYIELLQMARTADDTELTHYATTTMMEIQGKYEAEIHKWAEQNKETPHDYRVLKKYRSVLKKYVESGLISGTILSIYQNHLHSVLVELCEMAPDNKTFLQEKIKNQINMGNTKDIENELENMIDKWPMEEKFYFLYVDYLWQTNQTKMIQMVLSFIEKENMYLSHEGKKWFEFWKQRDLSV